ncbi:glycosyl transferase family 1 [Gleimia sp. 6138-11-ORH1]|uniref:glycosyl transferase family 1 n=1 Tax=Gleimia sp. 6138-11-ORH1 TaxID=2973937 RepID=UPI002167D459|nr:glycosyl transferase family 1 [Gleimia sp. 6138-11-ORH1]MCS4484032.1 glycosyl transferase family 1 [Gleimia sp. 6138-11-ORH1]
MPKMIYHVPYPLNFQATSGSGIRPVKMYQAFQDAGFEVFLVSGYASERRQKIKKVKELIRQGEKFAFLYSESATIPTALTEPKHLPPHLFLDFSFFRFCQKHGINGGVFYRDIYWAFDSYLELVKQPLAFFMRQLYRYDLRKYNKTLKKVFLPSLEMGKFVPLVDPKKFLALPPGCPENDSPLPTHKLSLLYIGGLGSHYKIHKLLEAIKSIPDAELTICTSQSMWEANQADYKDVLDENIKVVHESGEGLLPLFRAANVCSLVMEPDEYREFAVPIKLFDYLGNLRPVLASSNTLAGNFVVANSCGWTVDYSVEEIRNILESLQDLQWIPQMENKIIETRRNNTWMARALQVAQVLTDGKDS